MQAYIAFAAFTLAALCTAIQVFRLKKQGIRAIQLGGKKKRRFGIWFFTIWFAYRIWAFTLNLPHWDFELLPYAATKWIGANLCLLALALYLPALFALGKSFRIGLGGEADTELVQRGFYAFCRNPMTFARIFLLIGVFLVFPDVFFLLFAFFGIVRACKQVRREEKALRQRHGEAYEEYCKKTKRFC